MLDQNGWGESRTVSQGENWFVNWADFPSVASLRNGTLAAHWLVKSGSSTYAYDVNVSQSKDGKSWSKSIVPHRDNTQTEHGFVSLIPLSDGRLGAVWLDGRNMKNRTINMKPSRLAGVVFLSSATIARTNKREESCCLLPLPMFIYRGSLDQHEPSVHVAFATPAQSSCCSHDTRSQQQHARGFGYGVKLSSYLASRKLRSVDVQISLPAI